MTPVRAALARLERAALRDTLRGRTPALPLRHDPLGPLRRGTGRDAALRAALDRLPGTAAPTEAAASVGAASPPIPSGRRLTPLPASPALAAGGALPDPRRARAGPGTGAPPPVPPPSWPTRTAPAVASHASPPVAPRTNGTRPAPIRADRPGQPAHGAPPAADAGRPVLVTPVPPAPAAPPTKGARAARARTDRSGRPTRATPAAASVTRPPVVAVQPSPAAAPVTFSSPATIAPGPPGQAGGNPPPAASGAGRPVPGHHGRPAPHLVAARTTPLAPTPALAPGALRALRATGTPRSSPQAPHEASPTAVVALPGGVTLDAPRAEQPGPRRGPGSLPRKPSPAASPEAMRQGLTPTAPPRSLAELAQLASRLGPSPAASSTAPHAIPAAPDRGDEPLTGWQVGPVPEAAPATDRLPATLPPPIPSHALPVHRAERHRPAESPLLTITPTTASALAAVDDIAGAAAVVESVLLHEARRWGLMVEDS